MSTKRDKTGTYRYLQLCESYRNQQGKPRTRVLINFGRSERLNRKKIDSAVNALLVYSSNPSVPRASDLEHLSSKDYGDMLALVNIWARLGLSQSIQDHLKPNKVEFDVAEMVKVMVFNRISDPLSKLGILRWFPTVLIPGLKIRSLQYQYLLRAMDYLISIKNKIEKDLYTELVDLFHLKVDLVFLDLTSCYFEGEGPPMAAYGHSRDHRPDRKQIVLALAITAEGLPVFHDVLSGNTADVSMLKPTVEVVRNRYQIARCILVCDRGLVSEENLEFLDEAKIPYIVAIRRRKTKESEALIGKSLRGFKQITELDGLLVKEKQRGILRYILCHNPEVTKSKKIHRDKVFRKAQTEIDALNRRYKKGRLSSERLYHNGLKVLEHYRIDRYFSPKVEAQGLILYMEADVFDRERFLEGKFFLKTKLSPDELPTMEAVRTYKELQHIERAFRELKDFLRIRPIFHWTDQRVRAHVMICVLAYLFEKIVHIYCQRVKLNISPRRALFVSSQLKAIEYRVANQSLLATTAIQEEMKCTLAALDLTLPEKILSNQKVS